MDIVCLRNISINTLHKGDGDGDYDNDDDDDDDDNNRSFDWRDRIRDTQSNVGSSCCETGRVSTAPRYYAHCIEILLQSPGSHASSLR